MHYDQQDQRNNTRNELESISRLKRAFRARDARLSEIRRALTLLKTRGQVFLEEILGEFLGENHEHSPHSPKPERFSITLSLVLKQRVRITVYMVLASMQTHAPPLP